MTYTVLEGGDGKVYKAEFEGEGTQFVPVCEEKELEGAVGVDGKVVVRYAEGLVHKLALVEEAEEE